jgi:hypothetical protein
MKKEDAEIEENDEGDDDVLPVARALRKLRKIRAAASAHLQSYFRVAWFAVLGRARTERKVAVGAFQTSPTCRP